MASTRSRLFLAALLLLPAGAGIFSYVKYRQLSDYIISRISGQAAKKLGRQVRFGKIAFSPLEGVVIQDACVSRKPDFSKGSSFCAARTVIRPRLASLLRNRIYFSKIAFEKPVIIVREKDGVWDFADLLALLPETSKGLHLTWNTSELAMKDARLEAELETSGLSLALEHAELSITHYSSFGGNYALSASGTLKSAVKGKLLSAEVALETEANFDYDGLSSLKGGLSASDAAYGAITLGSLKADWTLFNIRKPLAEKNYTASVSAGKLLIPGQENSVRDSVSKSLALFSSAMGRPAPKIEDIEMSSLHAAFKLDNSVITLKDLALRTNFLDLDAELSIDGPSRTALAAMKAAIGASSVRISASGPLAAPELKPVLSATLSAKFKEALAGAETGLLKCFPVTGE